MGQIEVREYVTEQGHNLYRSWVDRLDGSVQRRIYARVRRLANGNLGDDRHLGGGLHEAKMDFGPGYRLYYGYHLGKLILLLCGGDKSSQAKDIKTAQGYWKDHQEGGLP